MEKLISELELKIKYRGIKPFTIKFKEGINLIVGENGIGKSSIISLLYEYSINKKEFKEIISIKKEGYNYVSLKFFDTEKMNPRVIDSQSSKNYNFNIMSKFKSHGESILPLIRACKDFNNTIIVIDEPESGISLSNQKKIAEIFRKNSEENNNQFIIVTHSYPLIKSVEEVFCMDGKKGWVKSERYLERVLK